MLPLIAAAGNSKLLKNAGLIIGGCAILGLGYWGYKNWKKKNDVKQAASQYGNSTKEGLAVQYAGLMYSALHAGWWGGAEDEKAVYATAIKIHQNSVPFSMVSNAYRKLYQKELVTELNRLFNPAELETFNNALIGKYKKI